ncbi:MAG TPA: hypothetical protein VHV83_14400, partial [Armatimonadota bacterium]|nr:hypothetical protein [Armatimonadota bacterium]
MSLSRYLRSISMGCLTLCSVMLATAMPYTVAEFTSPELPGLYNGREFPGAELKGEWLPAESKDGKVVNPAAIRLNYDLSKGAYVQFDLKGVYFPKKVSAIICNVRQRGIGHHPGKPFL